MACLNLDLNYFDHLKTKRLIGLLGRGAEVLPIRLWCHCGVHHAESGKLTGYSTQEIESILQWWGKPGEAITALVKVGFVHGEEGKYYVHEWLEHEGHIVAFHKRAKAANKKRWKTLRSDPTRSPQLKFSDPPTIPNLTNHTKKTKGVNNIVFPDMIDTPETREVWERFRAFRAEIRKKLTPIAEKGALKKLAEFSHDDPNLAVKIIEQSIANSWQGIFPLKDNHNDSANAHQQGYRKNTKATTAGDLERTLELSEHRDRLRQREKENQGGIPDADS